MGVMENDHMEVPPDMFNPFDHPLSSCGDVGQMES